MVKNKGRFESKQQKAESFIHPRQAEFECTLNFKPAVWTQSEKPQHPKIGVLAEGRDPLSFPQNVAAQAPTIQQHAPKTDFGEGPAAQHKGPGQ